MNQEPPCPDTKRMNFYIFSETIDDLNLILQYYPKKNYSKIIRESVALEARRIRAKMKRDEAE